MAEPEPTQQDLYNMILESLRKTGAQELAHQIERTVARGSIALGEVQTVGRKKEKVKVVTAMSGSDRLAVALEFLVAAAEVPLMINRVRESLSCNAVEWKPDEPGPPAEEATLKPIPRTVDLAELQRRIESLVGIMRDLDLIHPETA
jgi:hypothetical protein